MKRILFVDDEPNILEGLRRLLRPLRKEWEMVFVDSGQKALEVMAENVCDVVVSDMRMPGMDGAELLQKIMENYPNVVRIVLSGHSDKEMIMRSVGPTHQYLSKPCDAQTLKNTIGRALALRELLQDNAIKNLVSRLESLPSLPNLYVEIMEEVQSEDSTIKRVGEIISKDIGMTAKILKLVNSSFFGTPRHVSEPAQAASLLGIDIIKSMVLSTQIFSKFEEKNLKHLNLEVLWNHSMSVGAFAKQIVIEEGMDKKAADEAFMAGILHDIGKLIMADNLPSAYELASNLSHHENIPFFNAEKNALNASHAEIGAYLLGLWGTSDTIIEALAFHHNPSECINKAFSPLTAVHAANTIDHKMRIKLENVVYSDYDVLYFESIGLSDRIEKWEQICMKFTS